MKIKLDRQNLYSIRVQLEDVNKRCKKIIDATTTTSIEWKSWNGISACKSRTPNLWELLFSLSLSTGDKQVVVIYYFDDLKKF
jgi:hypothetical protein